jgi:hypothetical protein
MMGVGMRMVGEVGDLGCVYTCVCVRVGENR